MIFEALEPLHITTKTLGEVSLSPGDRLDWPDQAVKMLLAQYPESVRVVDDLPFRVGESVVYRVPDPRSTSVSPEWQEHTGTVLQVDPVGMMALIEPTTEPGINWRWVAWVYVQGKPDEK